jgi:amino acid adenylation domain-containing protein/FkbM family methyltransferase
MEMNDRAGIVPEENWWKHNLDALCDDATMPLDFPRSRIRSSKRALVKTSLSEAVGQDSTHLLTATAVVLGRYGDFGRVAIGLGSQPISNPEQVPFLVADLSENCSFEQLAESLSRQCQTAERLPPPNLRLLAEQLNGTDIVDRNPIFSIAVATPDTVASFRDVWTDGILYVEQDENGMNLVIDYSVRQFREETALRFASHIKNVLDAAHQQSAVKIRDIELIGNEERQWLLQAGGVLALSDETALPVHVMVNKIANEHPDWVAIEFASNIRSYQWLSHRAAAFAQALYKCGATMGDNIGICMLASDDAIAALLGILSAGMTAVPLDHTLPVTRSRYMIETADVRAVILSPQLKARLPEFGDLPVIETLSEPSPVKQDFAVVHSAAKAPVYILFTSGSTGEPKGVVMPHHALSNLVRWQLGRSAAGQPLRTLQRTSIAFDVGFQEVFSTLCAGGTLIVIDDETRADVSLLTNAVEDNNISRLFLPPVALHQLAEITTSLDRLMPTLQEVIVAGEQLRISTAVRQLFRKLSAYLENQYGPTETHVVTAFRLEPPVSSWEARPAIGEPIDNAAVLILGKNDELRPVGTVGEMCIAGQCVGNGYLNAQSGRAAFVDGLGVMDAFPFSRIYKTGDFGHFDASGVIYFNGRRDDQCKIRGYRVELGEIEVALEQLPGIRESAVAVHEDESGGNQRIAVYVVTDAANSPDASTIRQSLEKRLPPYMVPALSGIIHLDKLPLTKTGKVDRLQLPLPSRSIDVEQLPQLEKDTVEARLRQIWAKNLDLESVKPDDDFFELGGHSLLAIKIIAEINAWLGVTVPLASLTRGRTIIELSRSIKSIIEKNNPDPATSEDIYTKIPITITLLNQKEWICLNSNEAQYFYRDIFEYKTYDQNGIEYYPNSTIVDAGANIGMFALYACQKSPDSKIFCFEPVTELYDILTRNLEHISINAVPIRKALSDEIGSRELTYYPELSGMSSLHADQTKDAELLNQIVANLSDATDRDGQALLSSSSDLLGERFNAVKQMCSTTTLSSVIEEHSIENIDLLKIDVQRGELALIRGITDKDWSKIRQCVVEVHDEDGSLALVTELLTKRGFNVVAAQSELHRGTAVHFVYARRPAA